jgi:hypothetical protein
MKDIDNVVFTDEILEKYKDDSKMITELCKKLDENKKVQEEYEKFLKGEEKLLHAYEKIKQESEQLKDNWNKLKEWVNKHYDYYTNQNDYIGGRLCFTDMKDKMQELEQGSYEEDYEILKRRLSDLKSKFREIEEQERGLLALEPKIKNLLEQYQEVEIEENK